MKPTVEALRGYTSLQDVPIEERRTRYAAIARQFYDLATDCYEFGWGQSFHFAPRWKGETLRASILRYEHRVADAWLHCPGQVLEVQRQGQYRHPVPRRLLGLPTTTSRRARARPRTPSSRRSR